MRRPRLLGLDPAHAARPPETPSSSPGRWSSSPHDRVRSFADSSERAFPDRCPCAPRLPRPATQAWPPRPQPPAPRDRTADSARSAIHRRATPRCRSNRSAPAAAARSGDPDAPRRRACHRRRRFRHRPWDWAFRQTATSSHVWRWPAARLATRPGAFQTRDASCVFRGESPKGPDASLVVSTLSWRKQHKKSRNRDKSVSLQKFERAVITLK